MSAIPDFKDASLLTRAMTHRSALNEKLSDSPVSNERLEFLGDAVLELATTTFLFRTCPDEPEGNLTAYRSALVKTTTLAELATELGLGQMLYMSKGEEAGGGRENESLLANTMEALLGGLYLDQGFEVVESFLEKTLFPKFKEIKSKKLYKDAKSELQEVVQSKGLGTPTYEVVKALGPDHDKTFTIKVLVDGEAVGIGTGRSKQLAQQQAAQVALEKYAA